MSATPYWIHDGGESICEEHAGSYLSASIAARPRAQAHRTPLGTWERMSVDDMEYFIAKGIPCCETCR